MSHFEKVRTLRLRPYLPGCGPRITVEIYDTGRRDWRGCPRVAWRLLTHQNGRTTVVFDGTEEPHKWTCSGHFAVDGDDAAESVLAFASLRPGDTDPGFFEDYSPEQIRFVQTHGEMISMEREHRFCDANGNVKSRARGRGKS